MSKRRLTALALGASIAFVIPSGAGADPGASTHVDNVAASVGGNFVSVSGGATFVDVPKLVGEDSQGDVLVGGIGTDITNINISRTPSSGRVNFTLSIADQPPTVNGLPETVAYYWDITVSTGGAQSSYEIWAARSAQWAQPGSTNPVFRRYSCALNPSTGVNECGSAVTVLGRMQDGVVEWQVPASQINASAGSVISGTEILVTPTASGAVWGGLLLESAAQFEDYTVPGATVDLGIAAAGTPASSVPLTATGTVNVTTGAFTGTLPKPAQSGEYIVVARACFGAGNCGLASTTVTV